MSAKKDPGSLVTAKVRAPRCWSTLPPFRCNRPRHSDGRHRAWMTDMWLIWNCRPRKSRRDAPTRGGKR